MGYIMWFWLFIQVALSAWPDSYEHRIAAMDALRYDLAMPGVPHNKAKILSKCKIACEKGYFDVCNPEEWVADNSLKSSKNNCVNGKEMFEIKQSAAVCRGWDCQRYGQ